MRRCVALDVFATRTALLTLMLLIVMWSGIRERKSSVASVEEEMNPDRLLGPWILPQ